MKIRLITVVWGKPFVEIFDQITLSSLLANGNIVDLGRVHDVVFTIYTTQEDKALISKLNLFEKIASNIKIDFQVFSKYEIDPKHYGSHNVLWQRGFRLAKRNNEILFFIIPDLLYGEDTLVSWANIFDRGFRAIYTPGPQVVLETIKADLKRFRDLEGVATLSNSDIKQLLLKHLHPIHGGMFRESDKRSPFPEYDIRYLKSGGIAFRELIGQPFCLDPNYFINFKQFSPEDHLDKVITTPCNTLSVEPLLKRSEWYSYPNKLSSYQVSQLGGSWFEFFGTNGCDVDSKFTHIIRAKETEAILGDSLTREETEIRDSGAFFRAELLLSRKVYQIIQKLYKDNYIKAAQIVSAGFFLCNLKRKIITKESLDIFVPNDRTFDEYIDKLNYFLKKGNEKKLLNLIKNHVVVGQKNIPFRERKNLNNLHIICNSDKDFEFNKVGHFGDITIYEINRINIEFEYLPELIEDKPTNIGLNESNLYSSINIKGSAWANKSTLNYLIYRLTNFPVIEPIISAPLYYYREIKQLSIRFSHLKGVDLASRKLSTLLRIYHQEGKRSFCIFLLKYFGLYSTVHSIKNIPLFIVKGAKKIFLSITRKIKNICICYLRKYSHLKSVDLVSRKLSTLLRIYHQEGKRSLCIFLLKYFGLYSLVKSTLSKYLVLKSNIKLIIRVSKEGDFLFLISKIANTLRRKLGRKFAPLPDEALKILSNLRLAKIFIVIAEILDEYEKNNNLKQNCTPKELVGAVLKSNNFPSNDHRQYLYQKILELKSRLYFSSEYWLELGMISEELGDNDSAIKFYSRGLNANESQHYDHMDSPQALCAYLKSRIESSLGDYDGALKSLKEVMKKANPNSIVFLDYALTLRQLGKNCESLPYFLLANQHSEVMLRSPPITKTRDASLLLKHKFF